MLLRKNIESEIQKRERQRERERRENKKKERLSEIVSYRERNLLTFVLLQVSFGR